MEVGSVDGSMPSLESGFDADDEREVYAHPFVVASQTSPEMLCRADGGDLHVDGCAFVPVQKTYASIVASSAPQKKAVSKGNPAALAGVVRAGPGAHGWQPFVEPTDA